MQKIINSIRANSYTKTKHDKQYECDICKDEEWIEDDKTGRYVPCKCRELKQIKRILENSGISQAFQNKTFDNFEVKNKPSIITKAKNMAIKYLEEFENIKNTDNNSIALLGQVGSGKTHLTIAIVNALMRKGIPVRYMQYREDIMKIKQAANDDENYNKEIGKFKNSTVLLIDDLFKGAVTTGRNGRKYVNDADVRAMFEILNYRYLKNAPFIISSEYRINDLLDFDEGVGSRVVQRCKGRIIELDGKELNHRLFS